MIEILSILPVIVFRFDYEFLLNFGDFLIEGIHRFDVHLELNHTEHMLISGMMSAVKELVKKILGEKSHLQFIDAGSYQILFCEIPKIEGVAALISSGHNKLLRRSLRRFTLSMNDEILNEISKYSTTKKSLIDEINKLLLKAFPYLEII